VWVVGLGMYPAFLQRLRVAPNELAAERPYIEANIRMTHAAYGLDRIQEKEFPADETLDARALARNEATLKNIRLWDYRPLVRTRSQELDYPAGDKNVYTRYEGEGGISIGAWSRRLLFAARFGEPKIVLFDDLTADSRILIYRTIGERIRLIAPFFRFDRDPYMVVTDDGRLVWMLDGYTTSDRYP